MCKVSFSCFLNKKRLLSELNTLCRRQWRVISFILCKITWKMWSMKTIVLLSMTSAAPWTIPRIAIDLMLSRSACNTRNITAVPKYNGVSKTNEYPGWVMHAKFSKQQNNLFWVLYCYISVRKLLFDVNIQSRIML